MANQYPSQQSVLSGEHTPLDALVHHHILADLIATGRCPDIRRLATLVGSGEDDVRTSLHRLSANHGLVLHPNSDRIWVIHPFAIWPTQFLVSAENRRWWGSCAWCSLGVAAILNQDVVVTTTIGAEAERVEFAVRGGQVVPSDLMVHFSVPIARAWDNVIFFCGTVLVFHSVAEVEEWCALHGMDRGFVAPIETVWELAKTWYADHLSPTWKKWSPRQAQEIFTRVGLTGAFWNVPRGEERF